MDKLITLVSAIDGTIKPKNTYQHDFTVLVKIDGYIKPGKIELTCLVEVYKDKKTAIISLSYFDGIELCIAQLINELYKLPWRRGVSYENCLFFVRKTQYKPMSILELSFENAEVSRVEWYAFDKIANIKKG